MVNKVILVGNLGNDPEIRQMENGVSVARISLATNQIYVNSKGEKKEKTEWHQLECWHRLAEVVEKHLKKGMRIYAEGMLHSNRWEDEKGVRYSTVIRVSALRIVNRNNVLQAESTDKTETEGIQG